MDEKKISVHSCSFILQQNKHPQLVPALLWINHGGDDQTHFSPISALSWHRFKISCICSENSFIFVQNSPQVTPIFTLLQWQTDSDNPPFADTFTFIFFLQWNKGILAALKSNKHIEHTCYVLKYFKHISLLHTYFSKTGTKIQGLSCLIFESQQLKMQFNLNSPLYYFCENVHLRKSIYEQFKNYLIWVLKVKYQCVAVNAWSLLMISYCSPPLVRSWSKYEIQYFWWKNPVSY